MKKMIREFTEFISKEVIIDLVIGIALCNAFTKIINSLVSNLIMPLIGVITGSIDFSSLSLNMRLFNTGNEIIIYYGAFIDAFVNFFMIVLVIFIAIKAINKQKRNKFKKLIETTEKEEIVILREIRDSLRNKND